jgi:hypothetical protein
VILNDRIARPKEYDLSKLAFVANLSVATPGLSGIHQVAVEIGRIGCQTPLRQRVGGRLDALKFGVGNRPGSQEDESRQSENASHRAKCEPELSTRSSNAYPGDYPALEAQTGCRTWECFLKKSSKGEL